MPPAPCDISRQRHRGQRPRARAGPAGLLTIATSGSRTVIEKETLISFPDLTDRPRVRGVAQALPDAEPVFRTALDCDLRRLRFGAGRKDGSECLLAGKRET
jgi:hypothetical protein